MANEVDEFLNEVGGDSKEENPFTPNTEDPFATKEPEGDSKKEEDEEKLPFHKDPKVQRYIQKEIEKATKDIKPTTVEVFKRETKEEADAVTEVLTRIIGNDTAEKQSAIKDFTKVLGGMKEDAKREALEEIEARAEKDKEAELEAQNELTEGFESIEDTFNVDLTSNTATAKETRGKFIDFIQAVSPKDKDGQVTAYPDFQETYKVFERMNKQAPTNTRAKELSSRSMQRSTDASAVKAPTGNSWRDVDKIFSKLTN